MAKPSLQKVHYHSNTMSSKPNKYPALLGKQSEEDTAIWLGISDSEQKESSKEREDRNAGVMGLVVLFVLGVMKYFGVL